MMTIKFLTLIVSILAYIMPVHSIWWSLGLKTNLISSSFRVPDQNLAEFCSSLDGLTPGQAKLCELYSDHISAISKGARIGIVECQWQFRYQQWNCSTVSNETVFGPSILNTGKFYLKTIS